MPLLFARSPCSRSPRACAAATGSTRALPGADAGGPRWPAALAGGSPARCPTTPGPLLLVHRPRSRLVAAYRGAAETYGRCPPTLRREEARASTRPARCASAHRPGVTLFVDVPRGRHPAYRGAGRGVPRRAATTFACSPRYDPDDRLAARLHRGARPQAAAAARLPGPARAHRRLPGQRRRVEPGGHAVRGVDAAPRAAAGRLRRRPRPRAGRPDRRLGRPGLGAPAAGRHLPLLLRERVTEQRRQPAGRAPAAEQPRVRIAVSEAAAWTGRRFYGGRYRVIPNGVDVPGAPAGSRPRAPTRCASSSSARPSSARACPCCCAPSRRCASTCRRG